MAREGYTGITVTMNGRDALRDLTAMGTGAIRVRVSMSTVLRAALLHAERDPDGFTKAVAEAYENNDEEED